MAQTPPPPPPPPLGGPGGGTSFRPRGIGEILSAAFELYKQHWQSFIQIVAIVVIPLTILQYFLQDQLQTTSSVTVDQTTGAVEVNNGSLGRSLLLTLVVSLIGVLVTQLLTGAISRAAAGSLVGESLTPGDAFGYAFSRLGSILLVSILVGLIVAGGLILLIIPGIIFAVKLAVSIPALVVENRRGTDAIGRSWNLTTGHFWHVLGTYIVAAIIAAIVSGILGAIGGSNWFIRAILASIAAIITTPFTALVLILIYIDLRVRKEGLSDETLRRELAASGV
jgi:hypothetical protein